MMKISFCVVMSVMIGCAVKQAPPLEAAKEDQPGNKLYMTPNDVHGLVIDDTIDVFSKGSGEGTQVVSRPAGVTIAVPQPRKPGPLMAVHASRVIEAEFPFNDVVPSWNVDVPPGAGFVVELRLGRKAGDFWTPFYYLGTWGVAQAPATKIQEDGNGQLDMDYFRSTNRFDRLQYRFYLHAPNAKQPPVIRRVSLAYSNTLNDADLAKRFRKSVDPGPQEKWARRLLMDWRSQLWEGKEVRGSICSPTSVSMVLAYYGVKMPTRRVYETVYDGEFRLYGNWWRAVQTAYTFGVPGYIERFGDFNAVKRHISAGRPVIASIRIAKGELSKMPDRTSNGHLCVIAGFDSEGGVQFNDPAGSTRERGVITHPMEDVEKIWLAHGGVGYVLLPPPATQPTP